MTFDLGIKLILSIIYIFVNKAFCLSLPDETGPVEIRVNVWQTFLLRRMFESMLKVQSQI
jgi:hypothetical protein